ncbi:uncharacterized protein SPPG_09408 [Spizellomyces punctatus DAOM BR117]|uniref:Uncharacterized protein n=1 Tax=Spizellomyces punctatus (strain DAOM BR117) TaxID=645134 RepID=A0A0L0H9V2_SPIPD|nr:uncharacterized protein SPPG_09408 [Spizellomyces punctatus DAOM BR117]KNC97791.1 hypothetical protein SPPG_09408 [Spizellomyces punctatus DAOM BR117]|eukprot:XP_016605831.1 hypothetical protein SPPG_09408 [Spizellomyces punctatus DAOM BR117]
MPIVPLPTTSPKLKDRISPNAQMPHNDMPHILSLPYNLLHYILVDLIGEDLIVHAAGSEYLKLASACKLFQQILYHRTFRRRMMQSMATALHARTGAVMNKPEGDDLQQSIFRLLVNRSQCTREVCNNANPFQNPYIDRYYLLELLLYVYDPHELYRMALPYIPFVRSPRIFDFSMDTMHETVACLQWYIVENDENNIVLLKNAWNKREQDGLEVWLLVEFGMIFDYFGGFASGWTIGRRSKTVI